MYVYDKEQKKIESNDEIFSYVTVVTDSSPKISHHLLDLLQGAEIGETICLKKDGKISK